MKLLLDNNLPKGLRAVFSEHDAVHVREVLHDGAKDSEIFSWCVKNEVDVLITKDKQFSWVIAESESKLKCVICTFGNMSVGDTAILFEKRKTQIEYFVKSNSKILEI